MSNRRNSRKRRNNNRKVVRYRQPVNLNAGIVVFGFLLIYLVVYLVIYFSTNKVSYYEVTSGTIANDSERSFNAIAIRKEDVAYAKSSGYINFYARENSRVSKTTTLYSIDESGQINNLFAKMSDEDKKLSDENISALKEDLYTFTSNFQSMEYNSVYDFKNSLQGTVMELINENAAKSIYEALGESQTGRFEIKKSETSGIIEYYVDNFETKTVNDIKLSDFDKDKYSAAEINSGDLVEKNAPIYKTITEEEWSLVIPLDDKNYEKYRYTTVMQIRFKKDNTKVTTNFEIIEGVDKEKYGVLTFQKYLIKYATDRFIDIEVTDYNIVSDKKDNNDNQEEPVTIDNRVELKIPKSAIISKDFYVIPREYKTNGEDGKKAGFITINDETKQNEGIFNSINIFHEDEKYCYVAMNQLEAGDIIIPPATEDGKKKPDNYVIKEKQSLMGVYNINNGYTQFAGIEIVAEAGDYYIVYALDENNLMVYDHIILNAKKVKENQVIFQAPNQ